MKSLTNIFIPIFAFLLSACSQAPNSEPLNNSESSTQSQSTLSLEKVSSNDLIEIGPLQTKTISREIPATGRLSLPPSGTILVHAKTSGYISDFHHLPGDFVKKGKLLVSINHPGIIEKQRIFLETLSELDLAFKDFQRKENLRNSNATSELVYERTEAKKNLLQIRYEGLKNELEIWGIDVNTLEKTKIYQPEIAITAPHSGIIDEVYINPGQLVTPEDPTFRIANTKDLHLELQILSKNTPFVSIGQKVTFTIPGDTTRYQAKVIKINPTLKPGIETLSVHAHLEKDRHTKLIPGLFVNANIQTESMEVTGLPEGAVIKEGQSYFVYAVENKNLVKKPLKSVEKIGDMVVFSPLPFQQYITKGAYYLE